MPSVRFVLSIADPVDKDWADALIELVEARRVGIKLHEDYKRKNRHPRLDEYSSPGREVAQGRERIVSYLDRRVGFGERS